MNITRRTLINSSLILGTTSVISACGSRPAPKPLRKEFGATPSTSSSSSSNTASPTAASTVTRPPNQIWYEAPPLPEHQQAIDTLKLTSALNEIGKERGGEISVAILHPDTGEHFHYQPKIINQSASIAKIGILACLSWMAQKEGGSLSAYERQRAVPMITVSDNDPAYEFFRKIGPSNLQSFYNSIGMKDTKVIAPKWGESLTTAIDQVTLLRDLTSPNGHLNDDNREFILRLMSQVVSRQRFGLGSYGNSNIKNGWRVTPNKLWAVNSIGRVFTNKHTYLAAILTNGQGNSSYGFETTTSIARAIYLQHVVERPS